MTNKTKEHFGRLSSSQQQTHSTMRKGEGKYGYGLYQYCIYAQDQGYIDFPSGRISGRFTPNPADSQSDYTGATFDKFIDTDIETVYDSILQYIEKQHEEQYLKTKFSDLTWVSEYSSKIEEQIEHVVATAQTAEVDTTDDVSQLTSDQLTLAILDPDAESDMPHLRDMIFIAEDTDFSIEESETLAPWLLSFAERFRDSDDPQDEAPIWSAIRTGASMLRPDVANCLCPLLEPGHPIETSMVAVKMLGRIFAAQPAAEVDEYQDLANEAFEIADSLLNRHAIESSQTAAKAQLAIYALAAMASSKIDDVVKKVQELNTPWFTRQILHELGELASTWAGRAVPIADPPKNLLDKIIQALKGK